MSEINVLLLGETGVGKSMFINALANYLKYNNLAEARKNPFSLIPTKFELTSSNLESRAISTGSHYNENHQVGCSATQGPLVHKIICNDGIVNVIDTPGVGDTRGILHDEKNTKKTLSLLEDLGHLNAICILLKPSDSRLNILFNYSVKFILSQMNRDLRDNILFIFTNARTSSYTPGDTLVPLKAMLNEISSSGTVIPFRKENTFCVDNEAFKYLLAQSQSVDFSPEEVEAYERSWNESSQVCKKLINYIRSLHPSPTAIIVSIKDSKAIIAKMAKPLIEVMVLHEKSIARIQGHQQDIRDHQTCIDDLKSRLYIPIIEYKISKKIITDIKSSRKLKAEAEYGILGFSAGGSFKNQNTTDTHIEEYVEPYETKVEDVNVKSMLSNKTSVQEIAKKELKLLEEAQDQYNYESKVIVETAAIFVNFLKANAIIQIDDPFQQYIEQVLQEEKRCNSSPILIDNLESLLIRYKTQKKNLTEVNPSDVTNAITKLLNLKYAGSYFRQLYNELLD